MFNLNVFPLNAEFLKVTVSRSCNRTNFSWVCAKPWELYVQPKNVCIFTFFLQFFFMIYTYFVTLGVIFTLFIAQNFKTKVKTAQKKSTFRMSVWMVFNLFRANFYKVVVFKFRLRGFSGVHQNLVYIKNENYVDISKGIWCSHKKVLV